MAFELEFDETARVIRVSFTGPLSDEDLLAGYHALHRARADCGPCSCIIDYTHVTTAVDVSNEMIRKIVGMPPTGPQDCPQISVAPADVVYGLGRMFQLLSSETRPNLRIVRTMDEAYRLLGVEPLNFLPLAG